MHSLPVLDGLRAISILLVLAAHMLPLGPKELQLNHAAGAMGMSLFFSLSGFLITRTLVKNGDLLQFFARRMARIVPAVFLYLAFISAIFTFSPELLIANLLFVSNYWQSQLGPYTAHLWSLCVEVHFYAAIGLVVFCLGQRGLWIVWPACLFITALRVIDGSYVAIMTHLRVDEILAGACVATLYRDWNPRHYASIAVIFCAVFWLAASLPYSGPLQYFRPYGAAMVMASSLYLGSNLICRVLSSRPLKYIATVSYAAYIWHPLTVTGWLGEGGVIERYLLKRPISFALTFGAAHLSTFYWEQIWMKLARSVGRTPVAR